jgi:hypothetical protein
MEMESERHLINLVVDRSNGLMLDDDVEELLMRNIARASREWDGYVQGHMELPIEPVIVRLSGTMAFINGSDIINGNGTLFTTEVLIDDWIQPQDNYNAIHIVREIISDTQLRLSCNFYGPTIAGGESGGPLGNIYVSGVPDLVEEMVCGYTCYRLWARRGKAEDNNPFLHYKDLFIMRAKEIQKGQYRFEDADGKEIAQKPSKSGGHYDGTTGTVDYDFTRDSMAGFYGD